MTTVQQFLSQNTEGMIADIERLVTIETPSTDKPRLDECAHLLASYAASLTGGETEIVTLEKSGNCVVLRCGEASGEPPILLVGHYDTVWPAGTLETMPFSVDGSIARGPGIFDMKAGLVQGLWAIRALKDTSTAHAPVIFVLNSDEEIGSPESRPLIERYASQARAALVLEPSAGGALKTERKGVGRYTVSVRGRAAHAGLEPDKGVSAIDELARIVLRLHEAADMERGTTVNVGVIHGGTRFNVVAAHASGEVDVRIASAEEGERMHGLINAMQPYRCEADLAVEGKIIWPPMQNSSAIQGLFRTASEVAKDALGLTLEEASVGGASDGCTCAAMGIPVLDGLGAVGDGAHASHEHIGTQYVSERAALVAHLLNKL